MGKCKKVLWVKHLIAVLLLLLYVLSWVARLSSRWVVCTFFPVRVFIIYLILSAVEFSLFGFFSIMSHMVTLFVWSGCIPGQLSSICSCVSIARLYFLHILSVYLFLKLFITSEGCRYQIQIQNDFIQPKKLYIHVIRQKLRFDPRFWLLTFFLCICMYKYIRLFTKQCQGFYTALLTTWQAYSGT